MASVCRTVRRSIIRRISLKRLKSTNLNYPALYVGRGNGKSLFKQIEHGNKKSWLMRLVGAIANKFRGLLSWRQKTN